MLLGKPVLHVPLNLRPFIPIPSIFFMALFFFTPNTCIPNFVSSGFCYLWNQTYLLLPYPHSWSAWLLLLSPYSVSSVPSKITHLKSPLLWRDRINDWNRLGKNTLPHLPVGVTTVAVCVRWEIQFPSTWVPVSHTFAHSPLTFATGNRLQPSPQKIRKTGTISHTLGKNKQTNQTKNPNKTKKSPQT